MFSLVHQLAPERSQPHWLLAHFNELPVVLVDVVDVVVITVEVVVVLVVALVVVVVGLSPGQMHGGLEQVQGAWMPAHLFADLPLQ